MSRRNLYISIAGNKEIAGPVIITALYLKDDLNHPYIRQQFDKVRPNFDNLWLDLLLDRFLQEERVILLTSKINVFQFRTNFPLPLKVRNHVERLIAEFNRYGVRSPYCHYYGHGLAASPREEGVREVPKDLSYGSFISRLYANSTFRAWMRFYHSLYPYYEWDKNNGLARHNHLDALLRKGPSFPVHREEGVFNIGKYWYSQYKKNSWWALTVPCPPYWWKRYFPETSFLHFLDEEERDKVEATLFNTHPPDFKHWVQSINPPLSINKPKPKFTMPKSDGRHILRGEGLRRYLCQKSRGYENLFHFYYEDDPTCLTTTNT